MTEPTEVDLARWEKWRDLRARQAEATTEEELITLALEEEDLRDEGIDELLNQDLGNEREWYWLSFADEHEFLGVVIIQAGGVMEATTAARTRGINPGGSVRAYPLDPEKLPPEALRNRLLGEVELNEAGLI